MFRPRLIMLFLLLPLAMLWWWLAVHAPITGWTGFNPFKDGRQFSLSNYADTWEEYLILDIASQQYRFTQNDLEGNPPDAWGLSYAVELVATDKSGKTQRLNQYSHADRRTVRSTDMQVSLTVVRPVTDRFVVASFVNEIQWIDLHDPAETVQSLPVTKGQDSWIWRHPTLPVFRRSAFKFTNTLNPSPPQCFTELFRFDETGKLVLLSSWTHAPSGSDGLMGAAEFRQETIASLDVNGKSIELRSLTDGQLTKAIPLLEAVDLIQHQYAFGNDRLMVTNGPTFAVGKQRRYFSLAHEQWLIPPQDAQGSWANIGLQLPDDAHIALWTGRGDSNTAIVTDTVTNRTLCTIEEPGERFAFLDNNTLVSTDSWFGLTIRKHDLKTGATISTWRPFWWTLPLFAIALGGSVTWVVGWLRMPKANSNWAWLDLHSLLLLLLTLVVLRVTSVGAAVAVERLPYQHAITITAGYQLIAWAWVILGSGSVANRLVQLLIVYATIFGALSQALFSRSDMAWLGAALVTTPTLLSLPIFIVARVSGWRGLSPAVSKQQRKATNFDLISLRQLLIITAVCALIALAIRPIAPGLSGVYQLRWPLGQALGITLCGLVGMVLSSTNRSTLRRLGWAVVIICLVLLISESLMKAAYASVWQPIRLLSYKEEIRYGMGLYTVVFVTTWVLRLGQVGQPKSLVESREPKPYPQCTAGDALAV